MGHTTIWIDHKHATAFEFTASGVQEKSMKNAGNDDKEHMKKFFHDVANSLGSPDQLLIVGPGTAKDEFKHHIEDHHASLKKAIVGTEVLKSNPHKSEILTVSRKFFNQYFAWHNSDV